jgi:NAD(P)-dependent dehydrogenase (short-subunit alcohol dehydrogenase family)
MKKRSILITGCSSGIGYDAAHALHLLGWQVFATCRSEADCARLRDEGLESFRLDYSDPDSLQAALSEVLGRTGGTLDALFNNGAFGIPGAVEDLPVEALRSIFEVNVFGYHALACRVIPVMRAQGYGRIIQCSSVLGFVGLSGRGAYVASKFALEGLTEVLRIEMATTPIKVVSIQPGPITSRIRQNSVAHFERWIDWEASPRAQEYRTKWLVRLYEDRGPDKFELPASAVTRVLLRALNDARPRAKYRVTIPTHFMAVLKRLLPTRTMDAILRRS